ncbi:MAG: menaquinone biosynthesis protein [SAR324 cluster bacterium]|nr:menaquinone biosynthesis protein [SAR324 cluster bacterium]
MTTTQLRMGFIEYLNTLPVYYGIKSGKITLPCQLIHGNPVSLNQKIHQDELDISVISSFEYALNPSRYYVFPDLSISADGPVNSIYLFSNYPLDQIQGKIYLTSESYTSVQLARYLLKEHEASVTFIEGNRPPSSELDGELLIGDSAIRKYYYPEFRYAYDLSDLWKQKTGLPFVFALWVVRRTVYQEFPEIVDHIAKTLLVSRELSRQHYQEIAETYFSGIFPTVNDCLFYLENLRYELSDRFQKGFYHFQQCCVDMGRLNKVSPLFFIES